MHQQDIQEVTLQCINISAPSKYVHLAVGAYRPVETPVSGIIPSNSGSFNGQSPNALQPGSSGIPFAGNPFIPTGTGPVLDPSSGRPINPATGRPDNIIIDPVTGRQIDPVTGRPIDPVFGRPIDPVTGFPLDPATGRPVDPATGRPVDPATGGPVDPATGGPVDPATGGPVGGNPGMIPPISQPIPNIPGNLGNNDPSAFSKQDIIILSVFGGLFLLILLLLLLGWYLNKKREEDEDKPQTNNETANVGASEFAADESGSKGITSHWFVPFSKNSKETKDPAKDIEAANIGDEGYSQKSLSERINEWFSTVKSGGKSASNADLKDNPAHVEDWNSQDRNQGLLGAFPLFSKQSDRIQEDSKENINNSTSKSSKFRLFGKKTQSDEEKLLNSSESRKKFIIPVPFFLKTKKKASDDSLHASEIIEQASIHANLEIETPVEFAQADFVSQSTENNNLVLDSQEKELYVLPPMVRHSTVNGHRVEVKDVVIGNMACKKEIVQIDSTGETQSNIFQQEAESNVNQNVEQSSGDQSVGQTIPITDNVSKSGKPDEFDITTIEPDSPEPIDSIERPDDMALSIIKTQVGDETQIFEVEESDSNNISGAIVVTETTTIAHHKSMKSTTKRHDVEADDDLDKWAPPAPTSHVVVRTYTPSERDEMTVDVGDLIGIEKTYKDGWAKAQNITQNRKRGMLPLAVVKPLKSGPTQTVIRSAGGIWKAGATTSDKDATTEVINYRETYQSERIVTEHKREVSAAQKTVTFDEDHNFTVSDISDANEEV